MRITISRTALLGALSQVVGVVHGPSIVPQLHNALIEASTDGTTLFTCTDLEVQLTAQATADVAEAGAINIPARRLYDLCRVLADDEAITIHETEGRVTVKSGKGRYKFRSLDTQGFPQWGEDASVADPEATSSFSIESVALEVVMRRCIYAAPKDDVRTYLNGLLFNVEDTELTLVATNGHRLAKTHTEVIPSGDISRLQAIIPTRVVEMLISACKRDEGLTKVTITRERSATFKIGQAEIATKLISGNYPDYSRVIPVPSPEHTVGVSPALLSTSLNRVMAIADDTKVFAVTLEYNDDALTLHTLEHNDMQNNQSQANDVLDVAVDNTCSLENGSRFGFNSRYLMQACDACVIGSASEDGSAGHARLFLQGDNGASSIMVPDDPDTVHVVMPMLV